jgi:excisionase family DNA binding protein
MTDKFEPVQWPGFVTVPEVAVILRVSKMTVYRMIHRGDFGDDGYVRVGRSFRIKEEALTGYLKEAGVGTGAE